MGVPDVFRLRENQIKSHNSSELVDDEPIYPLDSNDDVFKSNRHYKILHADLLNVTNNSNSTISILSKELHGIVLN
jgi:hypothetical protein